MEIIWSMHIRNENLESHLQFSYHTDSRRSGFLSLCLSVFMYQEWHIYPIQITIHPRFVQRRSQNLRDKQRIIWRHLTLFEVKQPYINSISYMQFFGGSSFLEQNCSSWSCHKICMTLHHLGLLNLKDLSEMATAECHCYSGQASSRLPSNTALIRVQMRSLLSTDKIREQYTWIGVMAIIDGVSTLQAQWTVVTPQ